jgi:alpha-aminoadipic semialdehyde synthase
VRTPPRPRSFCSRLRPLTSASATRRLIERVEAKLVHVRQRCRVQQLDVRKQDALEEAVRNADVVVSLLPATMHIPVARLCVQHRRHLVTASYVR